MCCGDQSAGLDVSGIVHARAVDGARHKHEERQGRVVRVQVERVQQDIDGSEARAPGL